VVAPLSAGADRHCIAMGLPPCTECSVGQVCHGGNRCRLSSLKWVRATLVSPHGTSLIALDGTFAVVSRRTSIERRDECSRHGARPIAMQS
jgi:hypothetical protein